VAHLAKAKKGNRGDPKVKVCTNHSTFKDETYHSYAAEPEHEHTIFHSTNVSLSFGTFYEKNGGMERADSLL
jgi:hypothetical protein